jgi:uncharacterized protein YjbI with pentapeptide repeats
VARYRLELLVRPERRDEQGTSRLRLAPAGLMLAAFFAAVVIGLGALNVLALVLLHSPSAAPASSAALHDLVGVLWPALLLAVAAGAGLLVAIVIARRKARAAEVGQVIEVVEVSEQQQPEPSPPPELARQLGERFAVVAAPFGGGSERVRLTDVHALAELADDSAEHRQSCVDVLCRYLQKPYQTEPAGDAPVAQRLAFHRDRELRHTVIAVIAGRLRDDAATSWQGVDCDFSSVVFDGADFSGAVFRHGTVSFERAVFRGDVSFGRAMFRADVSFERVGFAAGTTDFGGAVFGGGTASFERAEFTGGTVSFSGTVFSGGDVSFMGASFCGGEVDFGGAIFSGADVGFTGARFSDGSIGFNGAGFSGGTVSFSGVMFSGGDVGFERAGFLGGAVRFDFARFTGTRVSFVDAGFIRGTVSFSGARFTGGDVVLGPTSPDVELGFFRASPDGGGAFERAGFSGGTVDFSRVTEWSKPPRSCWEGEPPEGLKLPSAGTGSS